MLAKWCPACVFKARLSLFLFHKLTSFLLTTDMALLFILTLKWALNCLINGLKKKTEQNLHPLTVLD